MTGMTRYSLMAVGGLLILQVIITSVGAANDGAMDLCVLVDVSDSKLNPGTQGGAQNLEQLRDFLIKLVSHFPLGDQDTRVALSSFTSSASIHHYLDDAQEQVSLTDSIKEIAYRDGDRLIGEALIYAQTTMFSYGNRSDVADVLLLVTGGRTFSSGDWIVKGSTEAQKLKDRGVTIYVLAIGTPQNEGELRAIASDPDHFHYFVSADYGGLQKYATTLFSPSEEPNEPGQPAGESMCADKLDLVFVLDDSSDLSEAGDWDKMLDYVINVLKLFQVERDHVRVGVVLYSTIAYDAFKLDNSYQRDRNTLEEQIRGLFHFGGPYRHVAEGINSANEALFTEAQGDRPEVRNVMVILMAGNNDDGNDLIEERVNETRSRNIDIFTLGLSSKVNRTLLEMIVAPPKQEFVNYWVVPDFIALNSYALSLASAICEQGLEKTTATSTASTSTSTNKEVQPTACTGNMCGGRGNTGTAAVTAPTLYIGVLSVLSLALIIRNGP